MRCTFGVLCLNSIPLFLNLSLLFIIIYHFTTVTSYQCHISIKVSQKSWATRAFAHRLVPTNNKKTSKPAHNGPVSWKALPCNHITFYHKVTRVHWNVFILPSTFFWKIPLIINPSKIVFHLNIKGIQYVSQWGSITACKLNIIIYNAWNGNVILTKFCNWLHWCNQWTKYCQHQEISVWLIWMNMYTIPKTMFPFHNLFMLAPIDWVPSLICPCQG